MVDYKIIEINDSNISSLEGLAERDIEEQGRIVRKTLKHWADGTSTFSKPGEKLWGIFDKNKCISTGGLSHDPYVDDKTVGRVRSIFVDPAYRRQGLSKVLLRLVINRAKENFGTLRLSTRNPIAAEIYKSFGFVLIGEVAGKPTYEIKDIRNYEYPKNLVR